MKILHVFHYSNLVNGVDRTTLTLLQALRKRGEDVFAIVPKHGDVTVALDELDVPYRVSDLGCCTGPNKMAELSYLSRTAHRSVEIENWIRKEKFDLLHLNTGHLLDAAIAAARAGVPAIWHIHSPFNEDFKRYSRFMAPEGYAWLLGELGNHVISVSDDVRASLLPWLPEEKITTLHNGIDIDDLERRSKQVSKPLRSELGIPPENPLVIGIGRISAQKDFATFIRVANKVVASHPNVCFAIAGPNEDKTLAAALQKQISELCLDQRVFILGARNDVPALLEQSDVFLSTAIFEGHPLTSLEAMSLKKPVVAMDCLGLRECIQSGWDGLLVPLGDEESCAKEVLRVLTDNTLGSSLGERARTTVASRYSAAVYANGFLDISARVCSADKSSNSQGAASFALGLLEKTHETHEQLLEAMLRPNSLPAQLRARFHTVINKILS